MIMVSVMSVSFFTASTLTLTAFISSSALSTTWTTSTGFTTAGVVLFTAAFFFAGAGPLLASFLRAVLSFVTLLFLLSWAARDGALAAEDCRLDFARLTAMLTSWLAAVCNSRSAR